MKKVADITFKNLPTSVVTAQKIRTKYFVEGDKIPKKYDNLYHDFINGVLCDTATNEPIVKNSKTAGQQRTITINGNKLHSAETGIDRAKVAKIKKSIATYFLSAIPKLTFIQYPLLVEFKFYINQGPNVPDLDNLSLFYEKVFLDCIQVEKFEGRGRKVINVDGSIPNDTIKYINSKGTKAFFTKQHPYLIVNFYNYESVKEYEDDRANVNLDSNIHSKVQKLAERFATLSKNSKFARMDDPNPDMVREFWQKEYDFYFEQLTNEFL